MTELLEKAFAEVEKLSPDEQDTFAQWILDELLQSSDGTTPLQVHRMLYQNWQIKR